MPISPVSYGVRVKAGYDAYSASLGVPTHWDDHTVRILSFVSNDAIWGELPGGVMTLFPSRWLELIYVDDENNVVDVRPFFSFRQIIPRRPTAPAILITQELIGDGIVNFADAFTRRESTLEGDLQRLQGHVEEYEIEIGKLESWLEDAKAELAAFVAKRIEGQV